jgi:hypothetical protein
VAHEPDGGGGDVAAVCDGVQEPADLFTGVAEAPAAVLLVDEYPEVEVHVAENRVLMLLLVLVLLVLLVPP